jgi:lysophospholipase L1-like esterase
VRALLALVVILAAGGAGAQGPTDFDGDAVANAQDNCDWASNPGQQDGGGVASSVADGIGDACQCGDLRPNGRVDLGDSVAVQRVVAGLAAGPTAPDRCSVVGGSSDCDAADALAIRQALAGAVAAVTQVCRAAVGAAELPAQLSACGDSITQGYNADCDCNLGFSCLLCLLGQEKPELSWWTGSSSSVWSVHDRYLVFGAVGATLEASASGARMNGGDDSFSIQADRVLAEVVEPDLVAVLLGGNDICSRDCASPANCSSPLFTDAQWTAALRAGLDKLVAGLPLGSTVYLLSVPRVQDLRAAGLILQDQESDVDCEFVWDTASVCLIATEGGTLNGETLATRLAAVAERQRRYNEILRDEAAAYTANTLGQNPRGIEVVAEYVDEATPSLGTYVFGPAEINGGDCFHPSLLGQNRVAELAWRRDPVR